MNQNMSYPVAAMLMAAVSQAQEQAPPQYRPFIMIGVLLVGYALHVFGGQETPAGPANTPTKGA